MLRESKFGVPVVARSSRKASLKLRGGDGEMARIVERAVDGRVGLGGPGVVARGRKCVDIVAPDRRVVDRVDAIVAGRRWAGSKELQCRAKPINQIPGLGCHVG